MEKLLQDLLSSKEDSLNSLLESLKKTSALIEHIRKNPVKPGEDIKLFNQMIGNDQFQLKEVFIAAVKPL